MENFALTIFVIAAGVALNAAILYYVIKGAVARALEDVLNRMDLNKLRGATPHAQAPETTQM